MYFSIRTSVIPHMICNSYMFNIATYTMRQVLLPFKVGMFERVATSYNPCVWLPAWASFSSFGENWPNKNTEVLKEMVRPRICRIRGPVLFVFVWVSFCQDTKWIKSVQKNVSVAIVSNMILTPDDPGFTVAINMPCFFYKTLPKATSDERGSPCIEIRICFLFVCQLFEQRIS